MCQLLTSLSKCFCNNSCLPRKNSSKNKGNQYFTRFIDLEEKLVYFPCTPWWVGIIYFTNFEIKKRILSPAKISMSQREGSFLFPSFVKLYIALKNLLNKQHKFQDFVLGLQQNWSLFLVTVQDIVWLLLSSSKLIKFAKRESLIV